MTFHLTKNAWEQTEFALIGKPSGTKLDKYEKDLVSGTKNRNNSKANHSFIIINHVIYALSNSTYFDPIEGSFSLVKKGITKEGKVVAIKIESAPELKDEESDAIQASIKDRLYLGQGLRTEPNMKIKLKEIKEVILTDHKLYTVMEWRGQDLWNQIIALEENLTVTQRKIIALRACLLVQALHNNKIIHGDIKAENLTAEIQGNYITLKAIDYDYAKLLKNNKSFVMGNTCGTPGFISDEILTHGHFSPKSDSFALAIMLIFQIDIAGKNNHLNHYNNYLDKANLEIKTNQNYLDPIKWIQENKVKIFPSLKMILGEMLVPKHYKRKDASALILYLCENLINDNQVEDDLKAEFQEYLNSSPQAQIQPEPKVELKPEPLLFTKLNNRAPPKGDKKAKTTIRKTYSY